MEPFTGEFAFSRLERVISGPDTVAAVSGVLDRLGVTRAVVVTGRTLGASPLLGRVTGPLGDRCVSVFNGSQQHVPSSTVASLVRLLERERADCVISFGGGSPIDTAKAAVHRAMTAGAGDSAAGGEALVHIAIPTTLSAGEFTSVAGVTDEDTRIKTAISDPRIAPHTVITDPTLTLETPAWLWAASGIRALDHAVESIYSIRHHPLSDALASRGLELIVEHLPRSLTATGTDRLVHRTECQIAAWMAVFGMTNAGFGLSHAFGHQIGPRWNVPHGITSCVTLPHAMRFMADLAPARFGPIAQGFGIPFDPARPREAALTCADRTAAFIAQFDLPRRLRDAHVPFEEVADVAAIVHGVMDGGHAVDRPVTRDELASLLRGAY
jgi:alcohol dehydrogenase class IV